MISYLNLQSFFEKKDYKLIIAADAEPFVHIKNGQGTIEPFIPAGGVAVAFDPINRASRALFIGRGKTPEDKTVLDKNSKVLDPTKRYVLKRLFFTEKEIDDYYFGFSNQTLWPLCHVAFERPIFNTSWYEGFKKVNESYAKSIKEEIKGKCFVWINDYQLSLVPKFLGKPKNSIIGLFWHIPWPTWEIFRVLPQKKEILESLLECDFIAFHRGYQARNFLQCVERELEARIDLETNRIFYNKHITTVKNLPMGVDTDVIKSLIEPEEKQTFFSRIVKKITPQEKEQDLISNLFKKNKVILGVDRFDYTKGLVSRMDALDLFFEKYPQFRKNVIYLGLLAPSREKIPAYIQLKEKVMAKIENINKKYSSKGWKPIELITQVFTRSQIMNFYKKTNICLVTPLDDGMNLVSKEFIISASMSSNPGMLVLSQFAGSAIDLTSALIVNPYSPEEVAKAIKIGLEMPLKERIERISHMTSILDERNIYEWAQDFVREAEASAKENRQLNNNG